MEEGTSRQVGIAFLKSPSGVVRVIQVIAFAVGVTCTLMTTLRMSGGAMFFYNISAACAIFFSSITFLLRVSRVSAGFSLPWLIVFEQLVCMAFAGVSLCAAAWLGRFSTSRNAMLVVASACGFVASLAYLLDFFFLCQSLRTVRKHRKQFGAKQRYNDDPNLTRESIVI